MDSLSSLSSVLSAERAGSREAFAALPPAGKGAEEVPSYPVAAAGGAGRAASDGGSSFVTATTDSVARAAVFGGSFGSTSLSKEARMAKIDEMISVVYTEAMDKASVIKAISEIDHPHVFVWYIGSHGYKKGSMDFYSDMISAIATGSNKATCHLYDMTAWGALHNLKIGLDKKSSALEKLDKLVHNVKTVASSSVFARMKAITEPSLVEYFNREVLTRPFLLMPSLDHADIGIKVGEVMGSDALILKDVHGMDTSKAYSILQYIEGMILTEMAMLFSLEDRLKDGKDFNIVFALPNDESKYYRDEEDSFAKDMSRYLQTVFGDRLDKKVNIRFCNFTYGEEPSHRPYNAPGAVVKTKELVFENVLNPRFFAAPGR